MNARDRRFVALGMLALLMSTGLGAAFATGPDGDGGGGGGERYADWTLRQTRTVSAQGENGDTVDIDIPEHNLTSITVTLTWTDDELISVVGRRDDVLTLLVEPPSTLEEQPEARSGAASPLAVALDLAVVPTDDDARHLVDYDYTNATGRWRVSVTVDANGLRDQGNAWGLTVRYTFYVGRLLERQEPLAGGR